MSNNNGKSNQSNIQDFWSLIEYSFNDIRNVETKPIKWGFFVERGINIFVAKAGEGKTLLLYTLAIQLLKEGKKIYYLDLDNPIDLPKDRNLPETILNLGLQDNFVYLNTNHYLKWLETKKAGSIGKFLKEFLNAVDENGIIFLDSIQNFIDTNEQKQATALMNTLRKYSNLKGLTFATIHHVAKTTGKAKGHTQIEDMADSVYMVKSHKKNSFVESWSLFVSKQRYRTNSELTIKLLDNFEFEISDVAVIDNTTLAILRYAVSMIRKEGQIKQSDLRSRIKEKFSAVGNNRIFSILKEFTEKGLFIERTGVKNAKYYEVNEESSYLSLLFDNGLSEVKKELLNTLKEIDDLSQEIEIKDETGSIRIFKTPEAIRNHIWKLKDREAEEILNKLKVNYSDSELDNYSQELWNNGEDDDGYIPF